MRPIYKLMAGFIALAIALTIGFMLFTPERKVNRPKYNREASRVNIDISQTEFYQNMKHGRSSINEHMGGVWMPMTMPIPEQYKDYLSEKIAFIPMGESMINYKQVIIMDIYTQQAFSSVSSYLKKHAQELNTKNPAGKMKILHDGSKGIIYQWRIADSEDKTTYLEIGKVAKTDEGVFSVKYINRGSPNMEMQRQRIFKFFGKV